MEQRTKRLSERTVELQNQRNFVSNILNTTQVIIMTSHASLETSVKALRAGAYDYLIKPFEDLDLVTLLVNRALDKVRLIVENSVLIEKLKINNEELADELHPIYEKVRPESDKRQINDLRKLRIFHELFDRNIYMLGGVYEIDDFFLTFIDFFQSNTKNIYRKISV